MPKMRQKDYFQASFCYLKKTLNEVKAIALQFSFNIIMYDFSRKIFLRLYSID